MLVNKEVIRPGTYWYRDQTTGVPRKLTVTPELTRYWHEQGNAMLATGLTVPVPCEHDFDAHPMTPADKLKANAGWVKEYRLDGDRLCATLDVQDAEIAKKLPTTIKWTSPWINSFTDGNGRRWDNVISHLALTTRPRITEQKPFDSVAAALSVASPIKDWDEVGDKGVCLSHAGLILGDVPAYPIAFSLLAGGVSLTTDASGHEGVRGIRMAVDDMKKGAEPDEEEEDYGTEYEDEGEQGEEVDAPDDPTDVTMEELICDLLGALGVHIEHSGDPEQFKRELYNAVMTKIHDLTGKGQQNGQPQPNRANPPGQPPNNPRPGAGKPGQGTNPLIQQEQQPMYMSLNDIAKISDPTMKSIALAMYNENKRLRAEMEASGKVASSLRDAKLREAAAKRAERVAWLGRMSPKVKADLDAMLSLPAMALSLGDEGEVVDPMASTLQVLEKGLADIPRLLTTDTASLTVQPQPTDANMLTEARSDEIADILARQMGCPPAAKEP